MQNDETIGHHGVMEYGQLSIQLRGVAEELDKVFGEGESSPIADPMRTLLDACMRTADSSSNSWLGYHSLVYYRDFQSPPAGAHFSSEWGLMALSVDGTTGDWREYQHEQVIAHIEDLAAHPDVEPAKKFSIEARKSFLKHQATVTSILTIALELREDSLVRNELAEASKMVPLTQADAVASNWPRGQFSSRDSKALHQGLTAPPHITYMCGVISMIDAGRRCEELSNLCQRVANHIDRVSTSAKTADSDEQHIFIGHGRSPVWRELKDFLSDRLNLKWEEFNRVSAAGIATKERLESLLGGSSMGFIVCTAEDEHSDGSQHARENVIHEIGLFQGHLGFQKAIVVIENGCAEFSNIHGLGQIRFPAGQISACFEEIRQVLEREEIL